MADKIDQITLNGTSWDIDLPPDATPSIDSLTASSKVEVKTGTSNNLGYAALTTDLISSNKYEGAVEVEQGSDAMLTKKATSYYADRIVLRQGINQPATLNLPPISYGTTKTLATTSDLPPTVSGTDDGTNWTSLTIGSTTKNIPSGGGSGITEISTQYTRIWDLDPGIYLLTYAGTKYLYYYGATNTTYTHTVVDSSGKTILVVEDYSTTAKFWYYDSLNSSSSSLTSVTRFYGRTSSSSGTTSSIKMVGKYQHDVVFTISGYGPFNFTYYDNTSSAPSNLTLANSLKGQVLTNLGMSNAGVYCTFGNNDGDRFDPIVNFTMFQADSGTVSSYVSSGLIVVSSHTATAF